MSGANGRTPLNCAGMDDFAEEFALGLLDGAERASVVAHLEGCRTCGTRVAMLAEAGEQLLLIAPVVEPPLGFEQRVLARVAPQAVGLTDGPKHLGDDRRSRRPGRGPAQWMRNRLALVAALAVVVGLAALAVGMVRRDDPPREIAVQMIGAHGEGQVGKATVVETDPQLVELDMARWMELLDEWPEKPKGPWVLAVDRADGGHEEHTLTFSQGAYPRVTLGAGDQGVTSLAIEDSTGHVWCSGNADLTTT
jgi:hypothetical protein